MSNSIPVSDINRALDVLRAGGLILYPTDTIWGVGCDATNPAAVERVYQLKGRDQRKSLIVLLDNENKLPGYVDEVPEIAYQLIEYTERPLTIVYSGAKNLASNLIAEDGSIGIRIVNHPFCSPLLQRFRKPLVSTSANLSGQHAPKNFSEISQEIINGVDYVASYGQDDDREKQASMVMKLEPGGKFSFLRR
ncbi:L-threonylcarbamoyladenylate synthase [Parapedobacter indicus]|uniref:L-threonylcarbamoyladenylate synthase n=1 Tax=Parapedobacter indicus TaxID=1477437 RepID=A0A1I3LUB7_9SPHI|nr:L-threonylcarbamoyladenylate synthase [Parapedobacter indicus]PPL01384.1 L-threonylcarbamoyladenylate synthase [Parapedobacter indicus]SFI88105.1 L-threonylcarbamoyladenylate synthase [Parapedobacter indicus]